MELEFETVDTSKFTDVVGQDSLTRFDKPKYRKKRRKNNRKKGRNFKNKKNLQKKNN
jgi:hypothetical protein